MLKNRYQEILVGMGLMSLVRGLVSLKRDRSILLIDDPRFLAENYHFHYLSEMEIESLRRVGINYDIPELVDVRHFLAPASVELVTHENRLLLGHTPYENLRELLRKYPELLDASDLDLFYAESPESFNTYFIEELRRYESTCYEASKRPKALRFDFVGPKWMKTIYARFAEFVNQEYSKSGSLKYSALIHLLSLSAEEKLKKFLPPEEVPFYFFRLLSPIYRLQDFFLITQLKRRVLLMGGDYKESGIQFWQIHERKFENLLLESFEGVISGERVLFFSHLPENIPFRVKCDYPVFRKGQLVPVKRPSSPLPPAQLVLMTREESLGSSTPYQVMARGLSLAFYHWPYPELPGSKPEFYDNDLIRSYQSCSDTLPFEAVAIESREVHGVTLDLRDFRERRKAEAPILNQFPLDIVAQDKNIQGFEYWGPFRYRSLGLLALCYGIEGI